MFSCIIKSTNLTVKNPTWLPLNPHPHRNKLISIIVLLKTQTLSLAVRLIYSHEVSKKGHRTEASNPTSPNEIIQKSYTVRIDK
jgi:hypothetical protein